MEIKTRDSYKPEQISTPSNQVSAMMKNAYQKTQRISEACQNSEYESAEQYANDETQKYSEQIIAFSTDAANNISDSVNNIAHRIRNRNNCSIKTREPLSVTNGCRNTGANIKHTTAASMKNPTNIQKKNAATVKAISDASLKSEYAKQKAKKAKKAAENAEKALKAAIKGAINAVKNLVSWLVAGGWIVLFIILIICMLGMIVGSAYSIFLGNDVSKTTDGDTNRDLRTAISTINSEYYEKIQDIQNGIENLDNATITINGEVGGMTGVWQDVLAVYAVEMSHGEEATVAIDFDSSKTQQLRDIFWDMVSISYTVTERTEEEEQEVIGEDGNVSKEVVEVIYRDVKISVTTKSAAEAAEMYSFTDEQNDVLTELMGDQFTEAWSKLIYGYSFGDEDIVAVAISQIGNVGGEPYWRWYGLSSRTEWCAIFVSWCAEQCGYIDSGIVPKFAWVPDGVSWFKARGQWRPGGYTPSPGDIIFFDWDGDGKGNHVGIVEYVENNVVHTVEGNSGDACKRKQYSVDSSYILGYGVLR